MTNTCVTAAHTQRNIFQGPEDQGPLDLQEANGRSCSFPPVLFNSRHIQPRAVPTNTWMTPHLYSVREGERRVCVSGAPPCGPDVVFSGPSCQVVVRR